MPDISDLLVNIFESLFPQEAAASAFSGASKKL
jgi:hypothetical protein